MGVFEASLSVAKQTEPTPIWLLVTPTWLLHKEKFSIFVACVIVHGVRTLCITEATIKNAAEFPFSCSRAGI